MSQKHFLDHLQLSVLNRNKQEEIGTIFSIPVLIDLVYAKGHEEANFHLHSHIGELKRISKKIFKIKMFFMKCSVTLQMLYFN